MNFTVLTAQAVSRRPLAVAARVQAQAKYVGPLAVAARVQAQAKYVGLVAGKAGLGQVFLRVLRFPPLSIIPSKLHLHL